MCFLVSKNQVLKYHEVADDLVNFKTLFFVHITPYKNLAGVYDRL
jgi:hypothetical protein